ncbi:MAG: hypothetical protein IH838_08740 [Proteobacteria bacterium]|nr:hypothetical protein [Pseudomonadota bacterium]
MYEQHFGLKKRPFRANATGTDVFVGPQIAATMAGLKKSLSAGDAIASVSGPVGSGKTTLVTRALELIGKNQKIIPVARMRLDSNDVLDLLLDELGIQDKPDGTIQRFGAFRRCLKELEDNNRRVFVTIEDGVRLGTDTLAEIEALTAADAGESAGASVVVMGDASLDMILGEPQLARMLQRIRRRYSIKALCAAELRGYLRHCFRLAGGDFEKVFDANAAPLLHHLSDGIPRIANNLVESAMTAAADQDIPEVSSALLARVAENEYGLSAEGFDFAAPSAPSAPEPAKEPAAQKSETVTAAADKAVPQPSQDEDEIPELIQDTLPDLKVLIPETAAEPPPVAEAAAEPAPVAAAAPQTAAESAGDDVPAWDRDPTMAELKPDLDALEQAMAVAQGSDPEPSEAENQVRQEKVPDEPEVIPEITLDHAISQRISDNLIDEPGEVSPPAADTPAAPATVAKTPAVKPPPKTNTKADAELEKIAAELAKAKSIEDVDDRMAETLFGEELNLIAEQFMANPPSAEPANDDSDVVVATEQPATSENVAASGQATAKVAVTVDAQTKVKDTSMTSASQRIRTVKALNAVPKPVPRKSAASVAVAPPVQTAPEPTAKPPAAKPPTAKPPAEKPPAEKPPGAPDSIENQINTSLTQTLKALDVSPPVIGDDEDDEDESKGGFFSRFKR